jgi:hypothetical protein
MAVVATALKFSQARRSVPRSFHEIASRRAPQCALLHGHEIAQRNKGLF